MLRRLLLLSVLCLVGCPKDESSKSDEKASSEEGDKGKKKKKSDDDDDEKKSKKKKSDDDDESDSEIDEEDEILEERVLEAFRNDPILSERAIDIGAIGDGIIELTGWVHEADEATHAVTITRGVPGVETVVNRLDVRLAGSEVAEALMLLLTADSLPQAEADRAMLGQRMATYFQRCPASPES